jgi:Zn-finger nucleic acid-binding protein
MALCNSCETEFSVEIHNAVDDDIELEYCPICGSKLIDEVDLHTKTTFSYYEDEDEENEDDDNER